MRRFTSWLGSWATTLHIMIFKRDLYRQLREPLEAGDLVPVPRPGGDRYAWVGRDKDGNLISESAEMTLDESLSVIKRALTDGWTSFSMWRQDGSKSVLVARMGVTKEPYPEYQPDEEDPDPYFTDDHDEEEN